MSSNMNNHSIPGEPTFAFGPETFTLDELLEYLNKDTLTLQKSMVHQKASFEKYLQAINWMINGFQSYKDSKRSAWQSTLKAFQKRTLPERFENMPLLLKGLFSVDNCYALSKLDLFAIPPVPHIHNAGDKAFALLYRKYLCGLKESLDLCEIESDLPPKLQRWLMAYPDKLMAELDCWIQTIDRRVKLFEKPKLTVTHGNEALRLKTIELVDVVENQICLTYRNYYEKQTQTFWQKWNPFYKQSSYVNYFLAESSAISMVKDCIGELESLRYMINYVNEYPEFEKSTIASQDNEYLHNCLKQLGLVKQHIKGIKQAHWDQYEIRFIDKQLSGIQEAINQEAATLCLQATENAFVELIKDFSSQGKTPFIDIYRGNQILITDYPIRPFKEMYVLTNKEELFILQKTIDLISEKHQGAYPSQKLLRTQAAVLTGLMIRLKQELQLSNLTVGANRFQDIMDYLLRRIGFSANQPYLALSTFLQENESFYGDNRLVASFIQTTEELTTPNDPYLSEKLKNRKASNESQA